MSDKTIIKNRGTGAGGSNTNKNGLLFEKNTDLDNQITNITNQIGGLNINYHIKMQFENNDKTLIKTTKLFKYMENYIDKNINGAHGCKKPDECYIDENAKTIFIIEKKFQQCSGSVCEKIQTVDFKLWQYNRIFKNEYKIVYIYCLSDWFKKNCKAEIEYLQKMKIPLFWGNDNNYKNDLIKFIVNYK